MVALTECPAKEALKSLSLGELSEENSSDLWGHVEQCGACQSEIETIGNCEDSLVATLRAPDRLAEFDSEPACNQAIVRSLAALEELGRATGSANNTDASLLQFAETIGEYEIIRPIGRGGMSNVFLARHTKLGREVALKVLASHRLTASSMRERFEAEMRAVGKLTHPNIVTAHDARDVDGIAVLVTEFIDGADLGQIVQRVGPLSIADACQIICEIAAALQYTSAQGFVHRDVKPSNIMLSRSGGVKLLDLGLARLQEAANTEEIKQHPEITGTGQTMGTADYIAPEQVSDSRNVDIRTDMYSLGCTFYKMLTGSTPFDGPQYANTFAKMTAHVSSKPDSVKRLREDCPSEIVRLINSMLAKSPDQRPQNPEAIIKALEPFVAGADLSALVQQANESVSTPSTATPKVTQPAIKLSTDRQSFWRRPVKPVVAVATGFLGLFVGFCAGIILVITNPDGTKTILQLAEGSQVQVIESSGKSVNQGAETLSPNNRRPTPLPSKRLPSEPTLPPRPSSNVLLLESAENVLGPPLEFALLVSRTEEGTLWPDLSEEQLAQLLSDLPKTKAKKGLGFGSEEVKFVPVGPQAQGDFPIEAWNNGQKFTMVSTSPKYSIPWSELQNQIQTIDVSADIEGGAILAIEVSFTQELGDRLEAMSSGNIGQQLAIVVDGQVVGAPKIVTAFSKKVKLTGLFSEEDIRRIRSGLANGEQLPILPSRSPLPTH